MKKIFLFTAIVLLVILTGCRERAGKSETKSEDLATIRTLGLAYLEEFKHEEAEKEFRKFIKLAPDQKFGYANLGLTLLRMGRYEEAKEQLFKAIEIDPKDADVRLILATVYQMNDEAEKALSELRTTLSFAPGHIKTLYQITEMLSGKTDTESRNERLKYLLSLAENAPGNIVPLLSLAEFYIKEGMADKAIEQLENILKQFPEFPPESVPFYDKTIALLKKGDTQNALIQFTIFHNYMKVYTPYQAGMVDLKGPGGSLIGFPLISFTRPDLIPSEMSIEPGEIKFTDITSAANINLNIESGKKADFIINVVRTTDFDSDGDIDLYVAGYDASSGSSRQWLFRNDIGRFTDIAQAAGVSSSGKIISAEFADFDNDGFLDLYVVREEGNILFSNAEKEVFRDITRKTGLGGIPGTLEALFFDSDHDGDLDIYESCSGINRLYRNNADGTFTDITEKSKTGGEPLKSLSASFGDFDEDGDIDFVVVNENGPVELYSNQRQNLFKNITEKSGLASIKGASSLAAADYNNDGYLDLFISATDGSPVLYRNKMNGTFEPDTRSDDALKLLNNVKINHSEFFDYDNDGFDDLLVAGEPVEEGKAAILIFKNDGKGVFSYVPGLIPETVTSALQTALFDYNDDGDMDILVAGGSNGVILLRNDGGNSNHFIKMRLVGLRTGSAKNNFYGIGAKVEIRAGTHYSSTVVKEPIVHFGLGSRERADVIRITWTNGVPQNIFMPGSDQALIEAQTLKGSCPFLYTWNGEEFVFAKDILWRSALGMPLGIMGEKTSYAFPEASDDYIKISSELIKPKNGKYVMQFTSELWETVYTDMLELVTVDHPDSIDVFVPEQFTPPPFPGLKIYAVTKKITPLSATDGYGNDMLPYIKAIDDVYTPGVKPEKYQGITEMNELIIDPGELNTSDTLCLFMTGWIFPTDASINFSISQSDRIKTIAPEIQVSDGKNGWKTIDTPGFPMGKDKTVVSCFPGCLLSGGQKLRILTNMDVHWDYIFLAEKIPNYPSVIKKVKPVSANLHFRGFSEMYRKGGRYGPHWFDYYKVSAEVKWRDLEGYYTRYGNVLPLLKESDNQYVISNAGDEITVSFEVPQMPAGKKGWKRSFFIRSVGWVKDGDLNTATGSKVTPLPFHGMKYYPYEDESNYPDDPALKKYNRKYNTRKVTDEPFVNALKKYVIR